MFCTAGTVTTLATNLSAPHYVTVSMNATSGLDVVYFSTDASTIMAVDVSTGAVTRFCGTVAGFRNGGCSADAMFDAPLGLAISGDVMYVVDGNALLIRAIQMTSSASVIHFLPFLCVIGSLTVLWLVFRVQKPCPQSLAT